MAADALTSTRGGGHDDALSCRSSSDAVIGSGHCGVVSIFLGAGDNDGAALNHAIAKARWRYDYRFRRASYSFGRYISTFTVSYDFIGA